MLPIRTFLMQVSVVAVRRHGAYARLGRVDDYWGSPEGLERKRIDRWLGRARAIVEQEPAQKGKAGRRAAIPFRNEVREDIAPFRGWPKPRAALAVDLDFHASIPQPPALWRLPKNYLDLLGATSAPADDPGPVLYNDDRQVKLLFASLWAASENESPGKIFLEARTRTSAITDLQLAGELLRQGDDELEEFDTRWAEADPLDDLDSEDENQYLPPDLAARMRWHDKSHYQAMLLGSNDRLVRSVFFQGARWLLIGVDPDVRRLERGNGGAAAVEDLVNQIAQRNADERDLLWSTIRIELPPLPQQHGDGARFDVDVRQAFRSFIQAHPLLQPLITPLRVTVLVVPPTRRGGGIKDLDNILMKILTILEEEMKPHPAPWRLSPPVSMDGDSPRPDRGNARLARRRHACGCREPCHRL